MTPHRPTGTDRPTGARLVTKCPQSRATARLAAALTLTAATLLAPALAHAQPLTQPSLDAPALATTPEAVPTSASTPTPAQSCALLRNAPEGTTATLSHGHADIFDLSADAAGALDLRIKEDSTGSGILRDPEKTLLAVPTTVATTLDSGIQNAIGAPENVYLLDQSGAAQSTVLWPGWDTLGVRAAGYDAASFHITYSAPDGGRIYAFTSTFEGLAPLTEDGSYELNPEGTALNQPYAAHTHLNWLFTRSGRYTLSVTAHAWSAGAGVGDAPAASSPTRTYTIDVGDEASCLNEAEAGHPAVSSVSERSSAQPLAAPAPQSGQGASPSGTQDTGVNEAPASSSGTGASGAAGVQRCIATRITREASAEEAAAISAHAAPANMARTTLTVNVGPGASGNANDGHFDLGPAIEGNTLVARVKDDRYAPAQWVDPTSLTFALGDAARLRAPADLSFITTPGSDVWMIPSTQIPGVPWVGLNSQREEIVKGTSGTVRFTLETVDGPGRVAVFNAGTLGSGVGEHVFDGAGDSYTLGANTHAHQNWVFTAPGSYTLTLSMSVTPTGADLAGSGYGTSSLTPTGETGPNGRPIVAEIVGRTASGDQCDLSLATTGADTTPLALIAFSGALTGLSLILVGAAGRRHTQLRRTRTREDQLRSPRVRAS